MRLILASASPRRAELLTAAGFTFDVRAGRRRRNAAAGRAAEGLRAARGARQGRNAVVERMPDDARHRPRRRHGGRRSARSSASRAIAEDAATNAARAVGHVHEVHDGGRRARRATASERGCARPACASSRSSWTPRSSWYVQSRRAGRQGRRLCDSGPCGALHRLDRRVLVERGRVAGGDGLSAARRRCGRS